MTEQNDIYISNDNIIQLTGHITQYIDTENWTKAEDKGWQPNINKIYTSQAQQTAIKAEYLAKISKIAEKLPKPCKARLTLEHDKPLIVEFIDEVNEEEDEPEKLGSIMIAPLVNK